MFDCYIYKNWSFIQNLIISIWKDYRNQYRSKKKNRFESGLPCAYYNLQVTKKLLCLWFILVVLCHCFYPQGCCTPWSQIWPLWTPWNEAWVRYCSITADHTTITADHTSSCLHNIDIILMYIYWNYVNVIMIMAQCLIRTH